MPFYAVRRGRQTGVYTTWKDCEEQVKGFPGPSFRKFSTEQEANDFINSGVPSSTRDQAGKPRKPMEENVPRAMAPGVADAHGVWYAVRRGRQTGLFSTWEECKEQVSGFQGAVFKKFNNHASATAFVLGECSSASTAGPPSGAASRATAAAAPPPVVVYTDGGCFKNGKAGARAGYGVWWGAGHPWNESARLKGQQTNNRAEIEAAIVAVQRAVDEGIRHLEIRTDSSFLISCITMWINKWRANGWVLSEGGKVKVREPIERLDRLLRESSVQVTWQHVRGHAGEMGNEAADRLAREGSSMPYTFKKNPFDSDEDSEEDLFLF